ncbi:hypothetical protein BTA51_28430 [Hahella sp. CCB-MM4]|uniref:DUF2914 domain-containing protein n=1 Tax=Hahella sp. (strain CCB-MM4) TaxID=1926491 RepID=UPI000B9A918C|nr:DUF2914 domain-containing protein [Hahella sp. CCB-MM4]OZG69966.1 hypothetical protein BTA51_28430 [Hahella sp. CCB-MM4]
MPAQHQSTGSRNINNQQSLSSQSESFTKPETAIHWDRIIIIGAIALLGVVLVGLLVAKYLDREAKIAPVSQPNFMGEVQAPSTGSQQDKPLPVIKSVETDRPVAPPSPELAEEPTTVAEDDTGTLIDLAAPQETETPPSMDVSSDEIELADAMASTEASEPLPIVETSFTLDRESSLEANANEGVLETTEIQAPIENVEETVVEDENASTEEVQVEIQPAPETVTITKAEIVTLAEAESTGLKTEVFSEHIGRIQLAWNVENYEPVDLIDSSINLDGRDLVKVHLFTVLRDLIDTTVYHDWYKNDQRVARVEIKPFLTPMRATSIKKISPYMLGKWRAEVVTEQGELLARVFFEVN